MYKTTRNFEQLYKQTKVSTTKIEVDIKINGKIFWNIKATNVYFKIERVKLIDSDKKWKE